MHLTEINITGTVYHCHPFGPDRNPYTLSIVQRDNSVCNLITVSIVAVLVVKVRIGLLLRIRLYPALCQTLLRLSALLAYLKRLTTSEPAGNLYTRL